MSAAELLVEADIASLRRALDDGETTAVELLAETHRRIAVYDRVPGRGARSDGRLPLNAVIALNPTAFADARAADARIRSEGPASLVDGIPYTAKESYAARGCAVAAGSPAFADLVAGRDAFVIEQLRAAGAVLVGLTTMPPMANGGMQRGLRGRAESPYSQEWLTSAFGSGSSNGSGSATAASIGVFGLGEETWSSGRAPASSNALCAYTPSRGVISMRGNWPLVPTMDVAVPHTRSMADMLAVLDVVVDDDKNPQGDFWRQQPWVKVPSASEQRPLSYAALADRSVNGLRLGVPRMFIGEDDEAFEPIETHPDVIAAWKRMRDQLEAAGAVVEAVDLPLVSNYEGDREGAPDILGRGIVSRDFLRTELEELSAWGWEQFLQGNGDERMATLAGVDGSLVFPHDPGAIEDRYERRSRAFSPAATTDIGEYPAMVERGLPALADMPHLADGLAAMDETMDLDWEEWLYANRLDAVVFPAVADVGPADADSNEESARLAWRNGTWVANGNLVWRHFGIPTVTVPMGMIASKGMPVGLTIAGRPHDDARLLAVGAAVESMGRLREAPPTPALPEPVWTQAGGASASEVTVSASWDAGAVLASGSVQADALAVWIAGVQVTPEVSGGQWQARLAAEDVPAAYGHSPFEPPHGVLVTALARSASGYAAAATAELEH